MVDRVQDKNWRELLRFCAARGAYRGAGSDIMRGLLRHGEEAHGEDGLFGFAEALAHTPEGNTPLPVMLHTQPSCHICFVQERALLQPALTGSWMAKEVHEGLTFLL